MKSVAVRMPVSELSTASGTSQAGFEGKQVVGTEILTKLIFFNYNFNLILWKQFNNSSVTETIIKCLTGRQG